MTVGASGRAMEWLMEIKGGSGAVFKISVGITEVGVVGIAGFTEVGAVGIAGFFSGWFCGSGSVELSGVVISVGITEVEVVGIVGSFGGWF